MSTQSSQELGSNPKTQFTPGPWLSDEDGAWIRQGTDGVWVAFTCEQLGSFGRVQKANAHIIAAAPEMYEALSKACAAWDEYDADNSVGVDELWDAFSDVRAAIAKAEGRTA